MGYAEGELAGKTTDNARNGSTSKRLKGESGEIELETRAIANAEFEPRLIRKHQTRFTGFDEKVLSLYARGMKTREVQGHLEEMYGVDVNPSLISDITDGVVEQAKAWQSRLQIAENSESARARHDAGTGPADSLGWRPVQPAAC